MKRKILFYFTLIFAVSGMFLVYSCKDDDFGIRNDYEFSVACLPVPKRLKNGETAEFRMELVRSGSYSGTKYYVRYFQPDGKGTLTLDGLTLLPNDSYELKNESFRMYYTSQCDEQQAIDLTFYDNFKNRFELSFTFSNDSKNDSKEED